MWPAARLPRLMGAMGLEGIIRGKPIRTTVSDKASAGVPSRSRSSPVPCPGARAAARGCSDFTLRRDLDRLRLCRLCHRHLCPPDRRLCGVDVRTAPPCQLRPGRSGSRLSMIGGPMRRSRLVHHSDRGSQGGFEAVVATRSSLADRRNRSSASAGVFQSSVFRGRELRAAATGCNLVGAVHAEIPVPLGKLLAQQSVSVHRWCPVATGCEDRRNELARPPRS